MVGAKIISNPSLRKDLDTIRLKVRYAVGQRGGAEERYKAVVTDLIEAGLRPTPARISYCLDRDSSSSHSSGGVSHNGRETRWRREVMLAHGWKQNPETRWHWMPPDGTEVR